LGNVRNECLLENRKAANSLFVGHIFIALKKKMESDFKTYKRLYANSYTMKISGNDTDFVLDLG
jgi:hypothetical protein